MSRESEDLCIVCQHQRPLFQTFSFTYKGFKISQNQLRLKL